MPQTEKKIAALFLGDTIYLFQNLKYWHGASQFDGLDPSISWYIPHTEAVIEMQLGNFVLL